MFGQRRIPRHMLLGEPRTSHSGWWRLGIVILIATLAFATGLAVADAGLVNCG